MSEGAREANAALGRRHLFDKLDGIELMLRRLVDAAERPFLSPTNHWSCCGGYYEHTPSCFQKASSSVQADKESV